MYRTEEEQVIFAERDRLVDKRNLTAKDRARLDVLSNLISRMPTMPDPEDQAACDFLRAAAAAIETAEGTDPALRRCIGELYVTNYKLREQIRQLRIQVEANPKARGRR